MAGPMIPETKAGRKAINPVTGTSVSGDKFAQDVNVAGGLGTLLAGTIYDYIAITYPTSTTESYVYKTGGVGGTTVATIIVTYVDATKAELVSVERT